MARYYFGGSPADFAVTLSDDNHLAIVPAQLLTVWDAETAGSQLTDLLDTLDAPIADGVLTADDDGSIPRFQGPDGVTTVWVDGGYTRRFVLVTTEVGDVLDAKLDVVGGTVNDLTVTTDLVVGGGITAEEINVDSTIRAAFLKTTSATEHAATIYQAGTSGVDVAAALNVVSDNPQSTALYLSGTESDRGTLKIAHRKPAASDANAAAISIDLQDGAGNGDSAAQGIFVTATEGATTGNLLTLRNNSRDDLVVKGTGRVGVGVTTGATPAGVVEVKQNDDTVVGLAMTGRASGAQMVLLKDSGGNARFEVNNSGNAVMRATAFMTTSVQVGSSSADLGGGTGVLSIKDRGTAPTSDPTGGLILYSESGKLKYRSSDGTFHRLLTNDGAWTSWTPSITGTTSGTWNPATTTIAARYVRVGRMVVAEGKLTLSGSLSISGAISGSLRMSLPITAAARYDDDWEIGQATFFEGSPTARWGCVAFSDTTTTAIFMKMSDGGIITNVLPSGNVFATGDEIRFNYVYEAAADV